MDILVTLWTPLLAVRAKTDQPDVIFLPRPRILALLAAAAARLGLAVNFFLLLLFLFFLFFLSLLVLRFSPT